MGFLNIMGGIAAGAQRADELEAKLEASKTKSNPAQKLVQKIMETGYTTSEDFTNQNLKISDLQKMSVGGLFGVYGKAVKYAKDQETYSTNIKSKSGFHFPSLNPVYKIPIAISVRGIPLLTAFIKGI